MTTSPLSLLGQSGLLRLPVRSFCLLTLALALAACGDAHDAASHGAADHAGHSAPGTADADLAFIDGMIPHHEEAVEMAALAADRAGSDAVRTLAARIAAAQQPEIDTLRAWRTRWFADAPPGSADPAAHGAMAPMDLDALRAASGEAFDREFLRQMILHHAGAVPMAADAYARSARPEVQALASQIVRDQGREIAEMQALLDGLGGPAPTTSAPTAPDSADEPPPAASGTTPTSAAPAAAPAATREPVRVAVTDDGFEPSRFTLPAGVVSRLVFTRTSDATCATSVQSAALGLPETALPLGQPVTVEVRPARGATYTLACSMDMVSATLVAVG